jgi:hypothetical protein
MKQGFEPRCAPSAHDGSHQTSWRAFSIRHRTRLKRRAFYVTKIPVQTEEVLQGQKIDKSGGLWVQWAAWDGVAKAWAKACSVAGW